ncbi:MAG: hypothetical protein ABTQ32_15700 [Myxococcaceae bacterium]
MREELETAPKRRSGAHGAKQAAHQPVERRPVAFERGRVETCVDSIAAVGCAGQFLSKPRRRNEQREGTISAARRPAGHTKRVECSDARRLKALADRADVRALRLDPRRSTVGIRWRRNEWWRASETPVETLSH